MEVQCEFCVTEKALIYCKSDSAKLCLNCDLNIHSANPLSQRHMRSSLCQKCFLRPTVVHCLNERISFCQECHCTGLGHRLVSLNPYSGCPPSNFPKNWSSILEPSVSNWVFPFGDTLLEGEDSNGSSSSMVTHNQNFECHSSSIFSMGPNLPKVLEEEFSSLDLCEGINFDDAPLNFNVDDAPLSFNASDDITGYSSLDQTNYYDYDNSSKGENDISLSSLLLPVLSENVVPNMSVSMMSNITRESRTATEYQDCGISPGFLIDSTWESNVESSFNPKPREEILKRYKHKKSKRMFGKQIRYASRKARADTRIRVKGRFVKSGEKFDYDQSLMI